MSKLIQKKIHQIYNRLFFYFLFYERQDIVKLIDETLMKWIYLKIKWREKEKEKKEEKKRGGVNVQKRENNNLH